MIHLVIIRFIMPTTTTTKHTPLLQALGKYLGIQNEKVLVEKLNHPEVLNRVNCWLMDKKLKTGYLNHNNEYRYLHNGEICLNSAFDQMAYNGYLNMTIVQHYYGFVFQLF